MKYEIELILFLCIMGCTEVNENPQIECHEFEASIELLKYELGVMNWKRKKELESEHVVLQDIELHSGAGSSTTLKEFVNSKNKIFVFHFTDNCCEPCIEMYLRILGELQQDIDSSKMLIIHHTADLRTQRIRQQNTAAGLVLYGTREHLDIPMNDISELERPFMMVVDNDMKVLFPRISEVPDSISNAYFLRITDFLNQGL